MSKKVKAKGSRQKAEGRRENLFTLFLSVNMVRYPTFYYKFYMISDYLLIQRNSLKYNLYIKRISSLSGRWLTSPPGTSWSKTDKNKYFYIAQISPVKQNQEWLNTEQIFFIHESLFPLALEFDTNYDVFQIIQSYKSSMRCPP